MENVRETRRISTERERKSGREKEEEAEEEKEDGESFLARKEQLRRMSRTRGYRRTEETGPRLNMIIEHGERCEHNTL